MASTRNSHFVNHVKVNGVRLDNGATFALNGDGELFDVVEQDSASPGTVKRAEDGKPFLGWIASKEDDGLVAVFRNPEYTALKCGSDIGQGRLNLQGDGAGGVKVAAAGEDGTLCSVYDTYQVGSQFYALVGIL